MPSLLFQRRHAGFLLLEVMLGIGVLAVFLSGIGLTMLLGQEQTLMGGDRIHAIHLSQQALEAARLMRDTSFDALIPDGEVRGVRLDGGVWVMQNGPVIDAQGFETGLMVTQVDEEHVRLRAETTWRRGSNRSGSVLLVTELTDWRALAAVGDWGTVIVQGSGSILDPVPLFTAAVMAEDTLFVTGDDAEGGAGLYVFDLSSLSVPRLMTSVPLLAAGLDVAIRGERLYVLTNDPIAELRIFSIANPLLPVAVTALNVQRDARATSLAFYGDRLLIGATHDAEEGIKELYLYDASDPDALTYVPDGSLDLDADILAVAVSGTSALLGTSDHGAEFRLADARDPPLFSFPPNEAYNAADDVSARSIATANSVALLGRSGIFGITRFLLSAQGFVPPVSSPSTHDVGGSVNGLTMDPTACVAFIAVGDSASGKEFQAVRLGSTLSDLGWVNKDAGAGRGLFYDAVRDRIYLLTDTALMVLRPGVGSLDCS